MKKKLPTISVKQLKALKSFLHKIFKEEHPELKKEKKGRGRPRKKVNKRRLFQLRKEGKSLRETAKELKVSTTLVRKRLEEAGIKIEKAPGRPKKEIDKEKLFQLRKEGKSVSEIAGELNVSSELVYRGLKEEKMAVFVTTLSPRGEIVIGKQLRKKLNLKPYQKIIERTDGKKIIIELIPTSEKCKQ